MLSEEDLSCIPMRLVQDFSMYTTYLVQRRILLSHKSHHLKNRDLYEINERLEHKEKDRTPRQSQRAYPLLDLFYRFSIEGELFKIDGPFSRPTLVPTERFEEYLTLTEFEKYCTLLEQLWVNLDWKRFYPIYHQQYHIEGISAFLAYMSTTHPNTPIKVRGGAEEEQILSLATPLKYFSYFGFWDLKEEGLMLNRYPLIKEMVPTRLGIHLSRVLWEEREFFIWNRIMHNSFDVSLFIDHVYHMDRVYHKVQKKSPSSSLTKALKRRVDFLKEILDEERGVPYPEEPFIQSFIPLFPTIDHKRRLPSLQRVFREGFYTLKVTLGSGLWRRIGLYHYHTLEDLHQIIDSSFSIDGSYLYAFFMDHKKWSSNVYNSPYCEEGPYACDVRIGELNVRRGMSFLYVHNFINEWHFSCIIEKIEEIESKKSIRKPLLLASRGEIREDIYE